MSASRSLPHPAGLLVIDDADQPSLVASLVCEGRVARIEDARWAP